MRRFRVSTHEWLILVMVLLEMTTSFAFAVVVGAIVFSLSRDTSLTMLAHWLCFGFALLVHRHLRERKEERS